MRYVTTFFFFCLFLCLSAQDTKVIGGSTAVSSGASASQIKDSLDLRMATAIEGLAVGDSNVTYVTMPYFNSHTSASNSISRLGFVVGVTTDSPAVGDSTLTHGGFFGKHLEVYRSATDSTSRGLVRLYNARPKGYTLTDSTITVNPAWISKERVVVEASNPSTYLPLVLNASPVTSPYTKTFTTFTSAAPGENLVDAGGAAGYITYSQVDNNARFVVAVANATSMTERGQEATTTTTTWESYGVPIGKTVTQVEIVDYKKKLVANTGLSTLSYSIELVTKTSSTRITSAGVVATVTDGLIVDADWVTETGSGIKSVLSSWQPSNSTIRLQINVTETSTAPGGEIRFDDIKLRITYQ